MIRRRIYFSILDPAYSRPGGTWWYRDFDVTMRRELVNTMTLPMHNTTNILPAIGTKWLRHERSPVAGFLGDSDRGGVAGDRWYAKNRLIPHSDQCLRTLGV